jgi:hypothetical protein
MATFQNGLGKEGREHTCNIDVSRDNTEAENTCYRVAHVPAWWGVLDYLFQSRELFCVFVYDVMFTFVFKERPLTDTKKEIRVGPPEWNTNDN